MKRFFGPVKMAEPRVSDAEQELFGGPLRYDMGWSHHEHAGLDLTMMSALRSMPALVGSTLRMAWQADRRALLAVAVSEIGQGVAAAVGLLAVNAVMHALLAGTGSAEQRLHALLPGLLAAAAIGVVNSALSAWSTSRAGRLEPKVERIATTPYLAAASGVEMEAMPARSHDGGGVPRFRSEATANAVMTGVCEFLRFGSRQGWVPVEVAAMLTELRYLAYLPSGFDSGERGAVPEHTGTDVEVRHGGGRPAVAV